MWRRVRRWASILKRDVIALWIAGRDVRTPLAAKLFATVIAAYALSPIDLIPDFIPVLGLLDDVILVPLGIALVARLIPDPLMQAFRDEAQVLANRPVSRAGLMMVLTIWCMVLAVSVWWLVRRGWI